jgi:NADH-quinone oxidoreductase subunit N
MLTTMLLSLAGLPLTAGFVGKFLILSAGAGAELWTLAVILAINGTISIFYYLKIVSVMFRGAEPVHTDADPVPAEPAPAGVSMSGAAGAPLLAGIAIAVLALAVVALGVYPAPFLSIIGSFTPAGG